MEKIIAEISSRFLESGAKTTMRAVKHENERKEIAVVFQNERIRLEEYCEYDPNQNVSEELKVLAKKYGLEPYMLQHIFFKIIPTLLLENENFSEQMSKMLITAKLIYGEELNEAKRLSESNAKIQRERNLQNQRGKFENIRQREERAKISLRDATRHNARSVENWMTYISDETQRIFGGQKSLDHLGPRNKEFVRILSDAGLVTKEGGVYEFEYGKFKAMDKRPLALLAARLNAALNR